MAGYTRQSSFVDGDTITADLFNDEYNQLVNVFSNTTGHSHDGTSAEGPVIGLIGDAGETSPNNKVLIDTANNYIEFYVEVSSAPVQQLYIADGAIIPVTDNDIDLGTSSLEFKNLYLDGTAKIDTLTVDEAATIGTTLGVTGATTLSSTLGVTGATTLSSTLAVTGATTLSSTLAVTGTSTLTGNVTTTNNLTVGGNLTVTGNATISGNLTFGDADTDSITLTADVASNITPDVDDTYDIGTSTKQWRNLYVDGTAEIDTLALDGTTVTSTATELNLLDGATVTTTEINILDGDTSATSTTLADADRVVVNDAGVMKQVALTDFETYFESALDTLSNVTTVGALNSGSITSGFGSIDNGSSAITTTGTITYGNLSDGTITITGFVDEDTMVSDSATLVPTQQSVKAYVDSQVTAQDLDFQGDSGGALSIDLDSETLTIAGGTGIDTTGATNTLTIAIDSTVATLTGTQTLTNKTLTTPVISSISNTGTLTLPTSTDTLVGRATTDTLTNKTLTSPVINTGVSGTAVLDDDTFATASATTLATSESIKAYVDAQILTEDTLAEMNDVNITTPADGSLLFYDTGTSMWIDNVVSGDITIADTGVAAISSGVIVNADINASAAISVSKTALVDGTGLTLTGDTLSVDASQTQITSVGTLSSLTVSGDATFDTSTLKVDSTNNRVGIGNATPDVSLDIGSNTDAVHLPTGTTAQRPGTPAAGYFRYNSEVGQFEGYTTEWGQIGGGGGSNTFTTDTFTGDGSTTAFILSQSIADENNLVVFNGGVFQNQSAYSVSGTTLTFDTAPANGNTVVVYSVASAVSGNNLNLDQFTGDGSTTGFTLSINPVNENNTQVFIDGVYQQKDGYTTSGTTLTFDTAPPNTATIEVMTFTQTDINTATILKDADEDTKVQVEESADEDIIRFDTAGTERMVINSTGVGINNASPQTKIHVVKNAVTGFIARTGSTATFENSSGVELYLSSSDSGYGQIRFGDTASTYSGGIQYEHSTDEMLFQCNGSERLRIDSSGNVGIGESSPHSFGVNQSGLTISDGTGGCIRLKNDAGTVNFDIENGGGGGINLNSVNAYPLKFSTSNTERMRINTSGHLLVGCTAYTGNTTNTGGGIYVDGSGSILFSSATDATGVFNRVSTDGNIVEYRRDGGTVGSISSSSGNTSYNSNGGIIYIGGNQSNHIQVITSSASGTPRLQPSADNTVDLGTVSNRFDDVFATNGTIQTSDRNEKQDEADLSDAETRVAVAAKGLLKKFKWKSAVEEKGDEARVHFGIIAQDLQDAFTAEGLDASDYAMFISSTWTDEETGEERTRLGVRYSELLAFIIAGI